ncbi:MAG: hypothetical protein ABW123_27755 [Cystobacter sp.]
MSDTTGTMEPLKMKLSFKKETLRIIDDNQLDLLDGVVGGSKERCLCLHGTRGCNTTNGDNENDNGSHNSDD